MAQGHPSLGLNCVWNMQASDCLVPRLTFHLMHNSLVSAEVLSALPVGSPRDLELAMPAIPVVQQSGYIRAIR